MTADTPWGLPQKRGFASDNQAPVHPQILKSIVDVNHGHAMSYGGDEVTEHCEKEFERLFGSGTFVFLVFNGTASNVVALRSCVQSHQSILASDCSHLQNDECGAPEYFTGSKIITVPTTLGKITLEALNSCWIRLGDQHYSQPKVLSITQPTEYGTVYTSEELRDLVQWAHDRKLKVHIDGARIANAVVHNQTDFVSHFRKVGVDIISFGGTKNGLAFGEAIVVFDKDLAQELRYLRKQSGQLPSKGRFVACQFLTYLKDDLWKEIATASLQSAQKLRKALESYPQIKITHPTESNAVFAMFPKKWIKPLRDCKFFYVWDEQTLESRLMTSWDTQDSDIEEFSKRIQELQAEDPA